MLKPFDPDLATAPTRRVLVKQVVDLLHVTHDPERIQSYCNAMRRGDRFPPISVLRLGRVYIVTDGHKRLAAAKALRMAEIDVEVWSVWRLARDLAGQSARHAAAAGRAFGGLFRGREGRRESRLFVAATVAHWRRTVVSLWQLVSGRSRGSL